MGFSSVILFKQVQFNTTDKPKSEAGSEQFQAAERGAAMVETAVVLPVFLAIMFITMNAMLFCFHLLQFQYEVSELTRQTFVLNSNQRGDVAGQAGRLDWQPFLVSRINSRARDLGMKTYDPAAAATVQFYSSAGTQCANWECASAADVGSIFSIDIPLQEPIFGNVIADISWATISVRIKAVAFVQKPHSEGEA